MTPKLKKIILTIVIVGVLFIVYAIFIKSGPEPEKFISNNAARSQGAADAQVLGNQIAQALLKIERIKLDKSIFDDEIYKSLTDRSQPILEEPIGRSNPFAPLGDISVNSVVRTATTTATSSNSN